MYPTPRFLARCSLAGVLVVLAIVFDDPMLLVGAATIGGWTVARQLAFTMALERTVENLTVDQTVDRTTVRTDGASAITLGASLAAPSSLQVTIGGSVPTVATLEDDTTPPATTLDPGDCERATTEPLRWPVSGRHEFEPATVTATDGGLRETITAGSRPAVTVEPRGDEPIHVGAGGDRIGTAYGQHEGGRLGSGDDPAEPREYVPGDTADKIDWKATARLGTTYVREFETETDRRTTLVVDHRSTLATGPDSGTKFDHLREAALSVAERAYRAGDPVGLVTVDDGGVSSRIEQTTAGGTYRTIRHRLLDLEPTGTTRTHTRRLTGDQARTRLASLAGGSSHPEGEPFETTLRPFYEARASGTDRVTVDSLTSAIRATTSSHNRGQTVIVTDDSRPAELRETVSLAHSHGNDVLVLLAPSVLYETDRITALEQSFDQYVAFENLRRDLTRIERVTALEVGPGDRLSAIVDAGRSRGDVA
ncbi:DUF58 domain-containing protein [Salinadaptatus halalkaliphilus]|uniref:DUF58 domain-containing protein n=1 Tax=Salinadaptatus halalkaliphilus TaxID=2419781 RepID=A0A4S3TLK1_9EURY|nr:DUF58 domain-containing protein [Salinadaptatus halalkaliphilus]THE65054.1 DUF58 domain-containing protein [Salinadaptatus halalkaliphilus]